MADSVAYQHTDGNRNYDGSYELHGVKKVGTDRGHKEPDQWGLGSYFFLSDSVRQVPVPVFGFIQIS